MTSPIHCRPNPKRPRRVPLSAPRARVTGTSTFWHKNHRFHGSTETATQREAEKVETDEREKAKATVAQLAKCEDFATARRCGRALLADGAALRQRRNTWKRLSLLIEFFGKDKLLTDISDDDVRALIAWRRGHRDVRNRKNPQDCPLIAPATVNLTIMQIKTLFATLRPRLNEPTWRKLWLPVVQEHPRELMGDEGDRLEAATRDDYPPLFAFARATGMRQSECLLRWSQVNWDSASRFADRQGRPAGDDANHVDDPRNPLAIARAASASSSSPMSRCGRIETGSRAALSNHAGRTAGALASAAQGRGRHWLPLPLLPARSRD